MSALAGLRRSRTLATATALFALYWGAAALIPNGPLMEGLQSLRVAVGVAVTAAYGSVCLEALLAPRPDRVQQLTLGIALAWAAAVFAGCWSLLWRLAGQPSWMLNAGIDGFWIWLQILGGVLHITAPGTADGGTPARSWLLLAAGVGAGALAGAALAALEPDVTPLVEALHRFVGP